MGTCTANSPGVTYFSIGEAAATLAVFFTVTQFLRPVYKFRISVGYLRIFHINALLIGTFVSVLLATLIPNVGLSSIPVVGYPVFWEFLGGLQFFVAVCALMAVVSTPAKFTHQNHHRFFVGIAQTIARSNPEELADLSREISSNASALFSAGNQLRRYQDPSAFVLFSRRREIEFFSTAVSILEVLSDETFCRIAVTKNPFCAFHLIRAAKMEPNYARAGGPLISTLLEQAINDETSILHREKDFSGLGHFKEFFNHTFSDYSFIEGDYHPLSRWHFDIDSITANKINRLTNAFYEATKGYLLTDNTMNEAMALKNAFHAFGYLMRDLISELESPDVTGRRQQEISLDAFKIIHGLDQVIRLVSEHANTDGRDFVEETYNPSKDFSIFGAIANAAFEIFQTLSQYRKHEDKIRQIAINLWHCIYSFGDPNSRALTQIQKRFEFLIVKKLDQNFVGRHPALLWLLIKVTSLNNPDIPSNAEEAFEKKFCQILQKKLPAAVREHREVVLKMLPINATYIELTNELIYSLPVSGKRILALT